MPRRSTRSHAPLDERAALLHSARNILRQAEHHLQSLAVQDRSVARNLADAQELVTLANANLADADASGRDDALHDLAAASDAVRRAEAFAAELADLKQRSQHQRDLAALHLRNVENSVADTPPVTPAS